MADFTWIQQLAEVLNQRAFSSVVFLTDSHVDSLYSSYCAELQSQVSCPMWKIVVPAGESSKSLSQVELVCTELLQLDCDRKACMVNFGGGMISDLGGFIASVYKRGIAFVNYPTTLMAMLDASIGGKTGVNLSQAKNMIGLVRQPLQVIGPDLSLLQTLPQEAILSGFGEMIKCALIGLPALFDALEQLDVVEEAAIQRVWVEQCATLKQEVVREDPEDNSYRHILNFGHTIGHAIESWRLATDQPIPHGVAVAEGIFYETVLSHRHGFLSAEEMSRIQRLIRKFYPPLDLQEGIGQILSYIQYDKKNHADKINFTLLDAIGVARPDCLLDWQYCADCLSSQGQ